MKSKKIISTLLALSLICSISTPSKSVSAMENENIIELSSAENFIKNWNVIDENGINHSLSINYETMVMTIDGEEITITSESAPLPRASTINYSSAINHSVKIPWKGSVILLSAAIAGLISGGSASSWAATIAGAITADAENIYLTYTQYRSNERYYSSYNAVYYNQAINKNIMFRESSSTGRILCGPYSGTWFDPIRP